MTPKCDEINPISSNIGGDPMPRLGQDVPGGLPAGELHGFIQPAHESRGPAVAELGLHEMHFAGRRVEQVPVRRFEIGLVQGFACRGRAAPLEAVLTYFAANFSHHYG